MVLTANGVILLLSIFSPPPYPTCDDDKIFRGNFTLFSLSPPHKEEGFYPIFLNAPPHTIEGIDILTTPPFSFSPKKARVSENTVSFPLFMSSPLPFGNFVSHCLGMCNFDGAPFCSACRVPFFPPKEEALPQLPFRTYGRKAYSRIHNLSSFLLRLLLGCKSCKIKKEFSFFQSTPSLLCLNVIKDQLTAISFLFLSYNPF